jgi:hypothetical protein
MNIVVTKGGAGSGNYGHRGRPGQVGGSGQGRYSQMYHDMMVEDWRRQHQLAAYSQEVGNKGIYVFEDDYSFTRLRVYEDGQGHTLPEHFDSLHAAYKAGRDFLGEGEGSVTIHLRRDVPEEPSVEGHGSKLLSGLTGAEEAGNVFYENYGMELDDFLENAYVQEFGDGISTVIDTSACTIYRNVNGVPYRLHIAGDVRDASMGDIGRIGYFNRDIDLATKTVEHNHFEVNPAYQDKHIGLEFYRRSEEAYVEAGIKEVKLFADMSVGGYAWARMGFDFDHKRYKGADSILNDVNRQVMMQDLDVKWNKHYNSSLPAKYSSYKHSWQIASVAGPDGRKVGKEIMLGSSWYGVKSLNPRSRGYKIGQAYYAAHDRSRP